MKKHLLSVAIVLLPALAMACSCAWIIDFCQRTHLDSKVYSVRIIHSYVNGHSHYVDAEFIENVQGGLAPDTLTLRTGSFTSCDPNPDMFQLGDTLIFIAGQQVPTVSAYPAFPLDFTCGSNFLIVIDGKVTLGNWDLLYELSYTEFLAKFGDCIASNIGLENAIVLYPNPASTEIRLLREFTPGLRYEVFAATGQLVLEKVVETVPDAWLDVSDWSAGVYFIRFWLDGEEQVERFVVH